MGTSVTKFFSASVFRALVVTLVGAAATTSLSGCAVVAVADAVVTVAATAVKVTAKTVGAAADIVLPSSDKKAEKVKKEKEKQSAKK